MAKEVQLPDGSIGEFPDAMPDEQIEAVLRQQFGGGGPAPDTRSSGRRMFDAVAQPVTSAVGRGLEAVGNVGVPLARLAQGESLSRAFDPRGITGTLGAGGAAKEAREQAARVVVPQTPLQAGIMAGTMAAGPVSRAVPALAPLTKYPAIARILGGTVGGAAGGAVEDPSVAGAGRGAAWGAGTTAGGELLGKVLGKAARSATGAKGAIAAEDATGYATEMGRQAPPLSGAKTVQDLQRLAQGGGRQALGGAKEQAVRQIEQMIGGQPLSIPALGPNPMALREANEALSQTGARAFSRNPLDRTVQGVDQRQLYGQIAQEIEQALGGLNPQAPGAFTAAQDAYKKGLALLRPLQAQNAYRLSPGATQFNTPAIQQFVQNPRNAALLRNKLGDQDYDALVNVLTRGAGAGKDVLTPGTGGMLDAAMQTFGRGTNSGATGYLGVPLRTLAPNIGSQYVGRQPLSLPPALQQALDLVLQRQAGSLQEPP